MESISIYIFKDKILFEILKEIKLFSNYNIKYLSDFKDDRVNIFAKYDGPKVLIANISEKNNPNLDNLSKSILWILKEPHSDLKKQDINSWLVKNGYAIAYRRYSKKYINDEQYAEYNKLGIWQGTFMKPEKWRRIMN